MALKVRPDQPLGTLPDGVYVLVARDGHYEIDVEDPASRDENAANTAKDRAKARSSK